MSELSLPAEAGHDRPVDLAVWRRVAGFALRRRRDVFGLVCAAAVTAAADVAFPLVTRRAIDRAVSGAAAAGLYGPIAAYAACVALLAGGVWAFVRLGGRLSSHVAHDIRRAAFDRLQELSFSYYDRHPVGWLMARMTSDSDRLARILTWGTLDLAWASTVLVGATAAMLWLAPALAAAALAAVPAVAWLSLGWQKRILASARRVRRTGSQITAWFNEALLGVRTTRALAREEGSLADFRALAAEMERASLRNAVENATYLPLVLLLLQCGTAVALVAGGLDLARGDISLGTLVAFLTYAALLFTPIQDIARNFAELQMAQAAAERVIGLIETTPEIADPAGLVAPAPVTAGRGAAVELREVSFAYGSGPLVVDSVSFRAEPGQTIALVGPTGGGKTTIASLICRFYEPTRGEVLIDGVDYRRLGLRRLRESLAVVLQTPHLFAGTVRENIRYGRLDATDGEVEAAAREVGAHDFIVALPGGYGSEVGEGGSRLSTGQRQLVSFARAVLARPRILVLDEATSSIDTESERRIQAALPRLLDGPTSFVIAHRLSTVRAADGILFVERGRIVEEGSHAELLARRGRYHALYARQRLDDAAAGKAAAAAPPA